MTRCLIASRSLSHCCFVTVISGLLALEGELSFILLLEEILSVKFFELNLCLGPIDCWFMNLLRELFRRNHSGLPRIDRGMICPFASYEGPILLITALFA